MVHYRWHPLHGRRLRRLGSEVRKAGRFVHVEAGAGVVVVVAAWMLDIVACTGMELGPPRVSTAALTDLHDLLTRRGQRRSSPGDPTITQEEQLGVLGLVLNAIVLWNATYIGAVVEQIRAEGIDVDPQDVARLSPLMHKHINFLGRYVFSLPEPIASGQLRPLKTPTSATDFRTTL